MFFVLSDERNHAFVNLLFRRKCSNAIILSLSLLEIRSLPLVLHCLRFFNATMIVNETWTWGMVLIQDCFSCSWVKLLGVLRAVVNSTIWLILVNWLWRKIVCGLAHHRTVVVAIDIAITIGHHLVQILSLFSLSLTVRRAFYLLLTRIILIRGNFLFMLICIVLNLWLRRLKRSVVATKFTLIIVSIAVATFERWIVSHVLLCHVSLRDGARKGSRLVVDIHVWVGHLIGVFWSSKLRIRLSHKVQWRYQLLSLTF